MRPNTFKNISKHAFFLLFFIFCGPLFADDKGQIININQSYQIAFTDLGSRVLSQGDIVKVSLNTDEFLYLQVVEASAILSKLGPSKAEGFQTNLNDFQRMAVGNTVVKINQVQERVDHSAVNTPESDHAGDLSELRILKLEEELTQAKEQIRLLIAQNQAQKQDLAPQEQSNNSKEILEQLKVRLDNMSKLVNEGD